MLFKRTALIIFVLVLVLSFSSCGETGGSKAASQPAESTEGDISGNVSDDNAENSDTNAKESEEKTETPDEVNSNNSGASAENEQADITDNILAEQSSEKVAEENNKIEAAPDPVPTPVQTMSLSEAVVHYGGGWPRYMGEAAGTHDNEPVSMDTLMSMVDVIYVTPENWRDYFEVFAYSYCYSYINNITQDYGGDYQVFLGPKEEYYYFSPYNITFGSKSSGTKFKNFALTVENGKIYRTDEAYIYHAFDSEDVACLSTDVVLYKINIPSEYIWADESKGFKRYFVNVMKSEGNPDRIAYEEIYLLARNYLGLGN